MDKPGGGTFFQDPNQGGAATRMRIVEMFWARLVDIYDVDANGDPSASPVFRDFAINENIQSDGSNYLLETNPITEQTRLVILREKDAPNTGAGTFDDLLAQAKSGLPPINPKNDDGTDPEPFSFVSRNACLVLRFDDVLDDSDEAEMRLPETVKVLVGYPPTTPFAPRITFDGNHGAVVSGAFHSTRVLIDMTVSEAESADMPIAAPVNTLGLPASLTSTNQPNVSVRIPTRVDFGAGQFNLLTNLVGSPLSNSENGPADLGAPTEDIVRAMRSGNPTDLNNGFLLDLNAPEILGAWPLAVEAAVDAPAGDLGFDFVIGLQFLTVCSDRPDVADIIQVGDRFFEVTTVGTAPDSNGRVIDLNIRSLSVDPVNTSDVLGAGAFLTTFDPFSSVATGCWVSFAPQPGTLPTSEIAGTSQVIVRFSEPMDPSSVTSFDTFMLIEGDVNAQPVANNIVVGDVTGSPDLRTFTYTPLLPFNHVEGDSTAYHVELAGTKDLAGNELRFALPFIDFTIDPVQPTEINGSVVVRFTSPDELEPLGAVDFRGQFLFDLDQEIIKPRPVSFSGVPADRINPVPSIMIPFPPGVQTPLSPFGSRMQQVWRYVDFGYQVRDETKYNLDVIGVNWSPIGGQVTSDFYEEFEMLLSHSRKQPDEDINQNLLPKHGDSGLNTSAFADNPLNDPRAPQKVVHPRNFGYAVNPASLFVSPVTGTLLMPFPMNQGAGETQTYTWRDTAALGKAAGSGAGVPLDIEVGQPLLLDPGPAGIVAPSGSVPTFGLPLLIEYKCYPSDSGVGLNAFDISLAINSSARPNFRVFSTGGVNTAGTLIIRNPDLQTQPRGGYNPNSNPPGRATQPGDNSFYIGQLDIVVRVSRAHSIWVDTLLAAPTYFTPILNPGNEEQPAGTEIVLEYRAAEFFSPDADDPFDAQQLDPYGELNLGTVTFLNGFDEWYADLRDAGGARYFQTRITFLNNIETGLNPELSAIGIAFAE